MLFIGVLLCLKCVHKNPCSSPERPVNIPKDAIWSGDCDGGNWIELVEIKDNIFRFRIYQDYNGMLLMDANFKSNSDKNLINISNWKNLICCYSHSISDSLVRLGIKENEQREKECYLESIYPAYAGEDWTIIQEKYHIE